MTWRQRAVVPMVLLLFVAVILPDAAADSDCATPEPTEGCFVEYFLRSVNDLNPQPRGVAPGPDGNVWFVGNVANVVGRITPNGEVTEFDIPTPDSRPYDIVAGPNGAMWFTESATLANKIGRIAMDGRVTEFALPSAGATPRGITLGPDGNLWFAQFNGAAIGRITPGGEITEFELQVSSRPHGIASGPDGNLWFTAQGGGTPSRPPAIGRITPDGEITEFLGQPSVAGSPDTRPKTPAGITAAADGALWFIDGGIAPDCSDPDPEGTGLCRVGRITTEGGFSYFIFGEPAADGEITAGPDSNLWFPIRESSEIVRAVPATNQADFKAGLARYKITSAVTPGHNSPRPNNIAWGPDANLWFTEANSGAVGRVSAIPEPALDLTPRSGRAACIVKVAGANFGAYEKVRVRIDIPRPGRDGIKTRLTNETGQFVARLEIPHKAAPGEIGVKARGLISALVVRDVFDVKPTEACS